MLSSSGLVGFGAAGFGWSFLEYLTSGSGSDGLVCICEVTCAECAPCSCPSYRVPECSSWGALGFGQAAGSLLAVLLSFLLGCLCGRRRVPVALSSHSEIANEVLVADPFDVPFSPLDRKLS